MTTAKKFHVLYHLLGEDKVLAKRRGDGQFAKIQIPSIAIWEKDQTIKEKERKGQATTSKWRKRIHEHYF
jgi:hypothetical protein